MPSSRCGVMFELRYCRVGPPCATGFSGRAAGCGGIEPGRALAPPVAGGVTAATGWMVDRRSGWVWTEGMGAG